MTFLWGDFSWDPFQYFPSAVQFGRQHNKFYFSEEKNSSVLSSDFNCIGNVLQGEFIVYWQPQLPLRHYGPIKPRTVLVSFLQDHRKNIKTKINYLSCSKSWPSCKNSSIYIVYSKQLNVTGFTRRSIIADFILWQVYCYI